MVELRRGAAGAPDEVDSNVGFAASIRPVISSARPRLGGRRHLAAQDDAAVHRVGADVAVRNRLREKLVQRSEVGFDVDVEAGDLRAGCCRRGRCSPGRAARRSDRGAAKSAAPRRRSPDWRRARRPPPAAARSPSTCSRRDRRGGCRARRRRSAAGSRLGLRVGVATGSKRHRGDSDGQQGCADSVQARSFVFSSASGRDLLCRHALAAAGADYHGPCCSAARSRAAAATRHRRPRCSAARATASRRPRRP